MKTALKKENFFVYRFLDADQATIYVGKTKNLTGRIRSTHFSSLGHLPDECYAETQIVVYSQCLSESDMTIQERYLINTLSPKYNDLMNRGDAFGFTINCFDWQYLPFIRPDERAKKPAAKNTARSGLLVSSLPNYSVETTKRLPVPSLVDFGTFGYIDQCQGELFNLYSFGELFEPLRGLWINGELWLSALSIVEFSCESMSNDNSSKIRAIQFVKAGFITCNDVCIVADTAFCRADYRPSFWGKSARRHGRKADFELPSGGLLIRANALEGYVLGLLERHARREKRRLAKGLVVKALYRSHDGAYLRKECKTLQEYYDFMAGRENMNANVFAVAYRIRDVSSALSQIEVEAAATLET